METPVAKAFTEWVSAGASEPKPQLRSHSPGHDPEKVPTLQNEDFQVCHLLQFMPTATSETAFFFSRTLAIKSSG
jgi:prophage antirepressor-like protein